VFNIPGRALGLSSVTVSGLLEPDTCEIAVITLDSWSEFRASQMLPSSTEEMNRVSIAVEEVRRQFFYKRQSQSVVSGQEVEAVI
jgi:hypothetical protein